MDNSNALIVDCRGLVCPQPVIRTRDALSKKPQEITVLVDFPPAKENVARFLQKSGYAVDMEERGSDEWAVSGILDRNRCEACAEADKMIAEAGDCRERDGKTLIFLSTNVIGHGSDELGAKLMANFLATLPEMNGLWRIVMVNAGVKLASEPGKCLDALKKLEAAGVSILVCGTCLDYYHLLEKKQVGETTNMLDIVTSLDFAGKVIRP